MTTRKPRKMPKNQRAYPKKGKPRLVEVTDDKLLRVLERGQGDIGVPNLIAGPHSWYVNAAELKKWRDFKNTSSAEQT